MEKKKNNQCVFCQKPKDNQDAKNFILERAKTCFVIINIYPYNNGHILIAPYRHVKNISSLSKLERKEIFSLLAKYEERIRQVIRAEGFNVGMNIGKASGAGFAEHIHVHLVPRWIGDTNFMPAIGKVKIIPESLTAIYKKLKDAEK